MTSKKAPENITSLNIFQKKIAVKKALKGLKAESAVNRKGGGVIFHFASSEAVLAQVNPLLNEYGLDVHTTCIKHEVERFNVPRQGEQFRAVCTMEYTLTNIDNPTEQLKSVIIGHGFDTTDKAVGKAYTYAERYYFLKEFNIPTGDDPEKYHVDIDAEHQALISKTLTWLKASRTGEQFDVRVEHAFTKFPELNTDKYFNVEVAALKAKFDDMKLEMPPT